MTTQEALVHLEAIADEFRGQAYVGSKKILNPILLTVWDENLPTPVLSLIETFLKGLAGRDLASPDEVDTLVTNIKQISTISS